jgi:uncharacterized protein
MTEAPKRRRGFALADPRVREWARMGGAAAQARGTCHRWTPEEARAAGRLGGLATRKKREQRGGTAPEGT